MVHDPYPSGTGPPATDREGTGRPASTRAAGQTLSPLDNPFKRWPKEADVVLAFGLTAAAILSILLTSGDPVQGPPTLSEVPLGAVVVLVAIGAVLTVRRRFPVVTFIATLAGTTVFDLLGYPSHLPVQLVAALYSLGRHASSGRRSYATLVGVLIVLTTGTLVLPIDGESGVEAAVSLVVATVLFHLIWFIGYRLQGRADRSERFQADQAERAVAEERSHIARELHDIVAHRVSMMTIQAGAAKTVARADPDGAAEAMREVELAGRQALSELRHLLNVLRPVIEVGHELGPQPGLADIAQLVTDHVDSGMDIELRSGELPTDVSGPVALYAYRIVQESLTNVYEHAGPTAHAEVDLTTDDGGLVIEVTNTGSAGVAITGAGLGIIGMRERATLLGGSLVASPGTDGEFRVRARLPLEAEPHR